MKKTSKILFGTLSLAAVIGGVYSLYKKRVNQAADFDDFEDSEDDEFEEDLVVDPENREYVSINITTESSSDSDESEEKSEEAPKEETAESTVETVVLEEAAPKETEASKDKESETDKTQE